MYKIRSELFQNVFQNFYHFHSNPFILYLPPYIIILNMSNSMNLLIRIRNIRFLQIPYIDDRVIFFRHFLLTVSLLCVL